MSRKTDLACLCSGLLATFAPQGPGRRQAAANPDCSMQKSAPHPTIF